jgi:hypothetical protein
MSAAVATAPVTGHVALSDAMQHILGKNMVAAVPVLAKAGKVAENTTAEERALAKARVCRVFFSSFLLFSFFLFFFCQPLLWYGRQLCIDRHHCLSCVCGCVDVLLYAAGRCKEAQAANGQQPRGPRRHAL